MTVDKLIVYNNALTLFGERRLSSLTEEVSSRYDLDNIYDGGAIDYCLEVVKPTFARKVAKLDSPSTVSDTNFTQSHDLPSDYITTLGLFIDPDLDQPLDRFIRVGDTIQCEYDTVYLHYVTNTVDISVWDISFANVVSAYLARELCGLYGPDHFERVNLVFEQRIKAAIELLAEKETPQRGRATTGTLTADWLQIYNDALLILGFGHQKLTEGASDSKFRTILDTVVDSGLVESMLEDIGWFWAQSSTKISYNPSIDPAWGYRYAFDLPSNMRRLDGVFADDYMRHPIKFYEQENSVIYADYQELYLKFVSDDFITTPATWPALFRRLIGARLAKDAAPSFQGQVDWQRVEQTFMSRESEAKSADVMASPPRVLSAGSWVGGRHRQGNYRGRP